MTKIEQNVDKIIYGFLPLQTNYVKETTGLFPSKYFKHEREN